VGQVTAVRPPNTFGLCRSTAAYLAIAPLFPTMPGRAPDTFPMLLYRDRFSRACNQIRNVPKYLRIPSPSRSALSRSTSLLQSSQR